MLGLQESGVVGVDDKCISAHQVRLMPVVLRGRCR